MCTPMIVTATIANTKAMRSLEPRSAKVLTAANDALAVAQAVLAIRQDWAFDYSDVTLLALTAARAAQTATMCARLVMDLASSVLNDAVVSPLLGNAMPTTRVMTTTVMQIPQERLQTAVHALTTTQESVQEPLSMGLLADNLQDRLRDPYNYYDEIHPRSKRLEDDLRCAADDAEMLHDTISLGRDGWWQQGADNSTAAATVVARVAREIKRAASCIAEADSAVADVDKLRQRAVRSMPYERFCKKPVHSSQLAELELHVDGKAAFVDRVHALQTSDMARMQAEATMTLAAAMWASL